MFLGTHLPKLDDKGRVILPAKFRDQLSAGLVVTRGQDRCLFVYSQREFESVEAKIRAAAITTKQGRDFRRMFLSGASEEQLDSQNRITVPVNLREYAGLGRELTVIGAGDHVEIWDTAAWNDYYESAEDAFAESAEEVIPGLF
jgi:MraZ protein